MGSYITISERASIVQAAHFAAALHPWRDSVYEVLDLKRDFLKNHDTQFSPGDLNARGRRVIGIFYEEKGRVRGLGESGGGPCERCGRVVEPERFNVCSKCGRREERAERRS